MLAYYYYIFNQFIDKTVIPPHKPNYKLNEIAKKTWDFEDWYREDNSPTGLLQVGGGIAGDWGCVGIGYTLLFVGWNIAIHITRVNTNGGVNNLQNEPLKTTIVGCRLLHAQQRKTHISGPKR
mgnify:CR=1 FL=1